MSLQIARDDVRLLATIAKGGLITVEDAAGVLGATRAVASARLGALARHGWLNRIRRGLYAIVPLEADVSRPGAPEDPWVVAIAAFAPCYIGGWTAAEHWGLTEQIFRSTVVVTAAAIRDREITLGGYDYRLLSVPKDRITDTVLVWRGSERVPVSSRERTIVDAARHPALVGGVRHLASIVHEYGRDPKRDDAKLIDTAVASGNGAAWKRLGYLAENVMRNCSAVVEAALPRLTAGYSRLDPTVDNRGKLTRRWRLWINVDVNEVSES